MYPLLDESVGEMIPQVGLNGQPLTKEDYVIEWENATDIDDGTIDFISDDNKILLSSINEMKYKLYAVRMLPFTIDNYRKEFDITRNLISLELKLRDVLRRSDEKTKDAIESYNKRKSVERLKDIERLNKAIDIQDIKVHGVSSNTLIKDDLLYNGDPAFIISDSNKNVEIPNYELSETSTDEVMGEYPVNYKTIMNYIDVFNHIGNSVSNVNKPNSTYIFNRPDGSLLLVGYKLLEEIPASFKDALNKYKSVAIGKYDRIISEVSSNNPYREEIIVDCCRCPKTGSFYIYLIMRHIEYPDDPYDDGDYIESYDVTKNNKISNKVELIQEEVDNLKHKLELSKKMYYETGDIGYSNRIIGLTYKLEKKEEELEDAKEEEKKSSEDGDDKTTDNSKDTSKTTDDNSSESDNNDTSSDEDNNTDDTSEDKPKKKEKKKDDDTHIDKDIQEYIDKLTEKGYKIRYAYSGKEIKSDDAKSLNTDARIMFDNKYPFEDGPEGWDLREVDKCSYLDINNHDEEDSSEDDDKKSKDDKDDKKEDKSFDDWKKEYLENLNTWIENLPESSKEGSKKEEDPVTEALLDNMDLDYCYNLMLESIKDYL